MSKFIETRCGSFINVNHIELISYNEKRNPDYNECLAEWIAHIKNKEYEIISFICKKEDFNENYDLAVKELKELL